MQYAILQSNSFSVRFCKMTCLASNGWKGCFLSLEGMLPLVGNVASNERK